MSEKQRSSIFKFFYIILRIITFPIYVVIYILKHPLWVLFFILLALGGLAYYPMSKGVHSSDILEWYKNKYSEVKYDVVKTVAEKADESFVPESIVKEVKKEQQKMDEEKEEAKRFKGENYNAKVSRQDEFEDIAVSIKKRGGFKKKTVEVKEETTQEESNTENVGGLSDILKKMEEQKSATSDVETIDESNVETVEEVAADEQNSEDVEAPVENKAEEIVEEVPATEEPKPEEKAEDFDGLELL